jgi:hypothetical protein
MMDVAGNPTTTIPKPLFKHSLLRQLKIEHIHQKTVFSCPLFKHSTKTTKNGTQKQFLDLSSNTPY